jgi:elongation factor P
LDFIDKRLGYAYFTADFRTRKGEAMYSASDLRKGLRVEIDGVPYSITEFDFVKPGKGKGLYNCKFKNLINGSTMQRTFRDNVELGEPKLEERKLRFSYADGDRFVFADDNYEEVAMSAELLGDRKFFLEEDVEVEVLYHNGRPIDITLQTFVEKKVAHTEPGARGDTATNVLKSATLAGGYEIKVPLFVNEGDVIRVDTRTAEYIDRVSKK